MTVILRKPVPDQYSNHRNQSMHLLRKSVDWFLFDGMISFNRLTTSGLLQKISEVNVFGSNSQMVFTHSKSTMERPEALRRRSGVFPPNIYLSKVNK